MNTNFQSKNFSPVLIIWDRKYHSSGFLYHTEFETLLVTTGSKLFDESNKLKAKNAIVYAKTNNGSLRNYVLNLNVLHKSKLIIKPEANNVSIIRMGTITFEEDNNDFQADLSRGVRVVGSPKEIVYSWESNNIKALEEINVASKIFTFNNSISYDNTIEYPQNRIYLRRGIISDINYSESEFVIDCPIFSGDEGSPVILKEKNDLFLIGITTDIIFSKEKWIKNMDSEIHEFKIVNTGLTMVKSVDFLSDF